MSNLARKSLGGWRVALRLARREALRRKAQTALMLMLICLPVLAVTAAAVVWSTQDVSSVEGADRRLGAAQALVRAEGTSRVAQTADPDRIVAWLGDDTTWTSLPQIQTILGTDRTYLPIRQEGLGFETEVGIGDLETMEVDLQDPLAVGLLELQDGRLPRAAGEVVVNRALAERGPGLGETLVALRSTADGEIRVPLQVVGIAEHSTARTYPVAAALTGSFGPAADPVRSWLVGGAPVTWGDVRELNDVGATAVSRAVFADPPSADQLAPEFADAGGGIDSATMTVLVLIVVMVLIEVVLLAGPAFAVRAKAQAHALALVAATGGTPVQARRTILATGVVVGVVGAVLGVGLGIAAGATAAPLAQRLSGTWFGPFDVPWLMVGVVACFGFVSALLAAVVPAILASRQDVVAVLAGRRGEGRPSPRTPVLGLLLIALGVAGSAYGVAGDSASPVLVGGSAIVAVLGMVLVVPLVVTIVARLAANLPLSLRFAARDAARHRTRTVPAVAAVGATVAGVVSLGIALSSLNAADEQRYQPQLEMGFGAVALDTLDAATNAVAAEQALTDAAGADAVTAVPGVVLDHGGEWTEVSLEADGEHVGFSTSGTLGSPYAVGTTVPPGLGLDAADRARAEGTLASGGIVVLRTADFSGPDSLDEVTLRTTTYDEAGEERSGPSLDVTAVLLAPREGYSAVVGILPPDVPAALGLTVATAGFVVAPGISEEQATDLNERLATVPGAGYLYVERGFQADDDVRIVQLVLSALGAVLMLGGTLTATFLALSDARADLATMAAVGARPRTRRGVAAAYALVIGLVGALLGAPIGFIPGVAITEPLTSDNDGLTVLDIPWPLIGVIVLALPLLTAALVGLSARSRLPLVARLN